MGPEPAKAHLQLHLVAHDPRIASRLHQVGMLVFFVAPVCFVCFHGYQHIPMNVRRSLQHTHQYQCVHTCALQTLNFFAQMCLWQAHLCMCIANLAYAPALPPTNAFFFFCDFYTPCQSFFANNQKITFSSFLFFACR
jgi:hypothetical protein